MHDELACITDAAAMYQTILDEADLRAWHPSEYDQLDPETELRRKLPWLLGKLSPAARALMRDHLSHGEEMIATYNACARTMSRAS
jgi:hypothetical protein